MKNIKFKRSHPKTFLNWRLLLLVALTLSSQQTFSWGGRGHHTICDAAVYLTQEKGLRDYLKAKPHIMGYLCNIPDTYWREISGEFNKLGNPTHFVDLELLGVKPEEFPTDYKSIIQNYTGKENPLEKGKTIKSVPSEVGSNWWRADQFYRRATANAEAWKATPTPQNKQEEQDENLPFNKFAADFVINLGVMGHFVGDNSQPYHTSVDYDGWLSGHGGIHAYYEETMVTAQDSKLLDEVINEGKKLQKKKKSISFLKNQSVVENMKQLALISNKDLATIQKIDKVITPSSIKEEKGMKLKTPAVRANIEKMAPLFKPLITLHMARSAALLAKIWDDAYIQNGRPSLASHKSYKFPHKPDFVIPDYIGEIEKPASSNEKK